MRTKIMANEERNSWDYDIDDTKLKEKQNYDLGGIYEHAHSELSLQQSKRDQIITIYLALCSFLIPFALGEKILDMRMKGLIFLIVGIVGVLFSYITIRYREYKEVYWLCCQTLTVLLSFRPEEMGKELVQRGFYHCLYMKGKDYLIDKKGGKLINRTLYVKKNIFSSETLHFAIIDLMCSFIVGLGISLILLPLGFWRIVIGVTAGLILFLYLMWVYFNTCIKVYGCIEKRNDKEDNARRDAAFNKAFKKAWFLHFYYDAKKHLI